MYEGFRDYGFGPTEEQYKTQLALLGREPEVYEDFVAEVAKEWRQEAKITSDSIPPWVLL